MTMSASAQSRMVYFWSSHALVRLSDDIGDGVATRRSVPMGPAGPSDVGLTTQKIGQTVMNMVVSVEHGTALFLGEPLVSEPNDAEPTGILYNRTGE